MYIYTHKREPRACPAEHSFKLFSDVKNALNSMHFLSKVGKGRRNICQDDEISDKTVRPAATPRGRG